MATARDLITRALRRAHIVATGEPPEDEQISEGLDSFNDMLEAWKDEGIPHGFPELELDTVVPIDRGAHRALIDNLAVNCADDAGAPVSQSLALRAERGRASLIARYFGSPNARVDRALVATRRFDIDVG
jgi:hypothetical protein